ncbi:MAG: 3-hydroxyacyl-CoA dehydrogenase NAD-binding domain-containing protein [Pusillimonas sp.]
MLMPDSGTPIRRRAVIVGGGTMGAGVAAVFIAAGWGVVVVEPLAKARGSIAARVGLLLDKDEAGLAGVLRPVSSLSQVNWKRVEILSENAPEDLALKRRIFELLDESAPRDVVLTSNSSTFSMRSLARGLHGSSRMLGVHFLMPAHIVPLVEILDTGPASGHVVEKARNILLSLGKKPVCLKKEVPGFLANRMQAALMREALALVEDGVATAQDVDAAVRFGFGFRYAACGPIVQKEHSGWDISHKVYQTVFPSLNNSVEPPPVLDRLIQAGAFGMKAGCGFVQWTEPAARHEQARFNLAMRRAVEVARADGDDAPLDWRPHP